MSDYQLNQYLADKGIYYKHSGKVNPLGIVLVPLIGILGAAILSIVYAYATVYIPFVYLNFFITLGYGFAIGHLVVKAAEAGKIRNLKLVLFFGIIIAIFAEYFNWVSWIFAYTKTKVFVASPIDIIRIMGILGHLGAWSIKSVVVKGGFLYFVWFVEAVIIMGLIIAHSYTTIKSMPFCERCNIWIKSKIRISRLQPITDVAGFKNELERKDYSRLLNLERMSSSDNAYTVIELLICPSCREQHLLNVEKVRITTNSKGKKIESHTTIIENLIISEDTFLLARSLGRVKSVPPVQA